MIQPRNRSSKRNKRDATSLDERFLERLGEQEEKPQQDPGEGRPFGTMPNTWMVVETDPRGQEAVLAHLSLGGDTSITPSHIIGALSEHYNVREGIDEEAIKILLERALERPDAILNSGQVIARAKKAVPGDDGRIDWVEKLNKKRLTESFQVHAALKLNSLESAMKCDARTFLVFPEQVLAHVYPETEGEPGLNIFGEESLIPGRPLPLELGENLHIEDDKIIAESFGYLGLGEGVLSIVPPLWIAEDSMRAVYCHMKLFTRAPIPTADIVRNALVNCNVTYGINNRAIEKLCSKRLSPKRKRVLTMARGGPPIDGEDTRIEYSFEPDERPGKIMPDGSIDFRERNVVTGVYEDQLLATVHPATEGIKGYTIFNEELDAKDGQECFYEAGENVRTEGNPPAKFFSTVEGNAHVEGETIHVKPIVVINGDVDYETGNIDTTTDVQISGNVKAGFTVESEGTIMVSGSVESGATVIAGGDVVVSQGIVGDDTDVVARGLISMGTIQCKFIQTAKVLAKDTIEVGSYIFNSLVRCNGNVVVHSGGGSRGGSIVGGEVFAANAIEAKNVGSSTTAGTIVGLNIDPVTAIKLAKLRKEHNELNSSIDLALRTLGLDTIDNDRIKIIQNTTPKSRRADISEIIAKLYEDKEARDKVMTEIWPLAEKNSGVEENAKIEVTGTIYHGAEVHLGQSVLVVDQDIQRSRFYQQDDAVTHQSL